MRALQLSFAAAFLLGLLPSCSGTGDAATRNDTDARVLDSSGGTVALGLDEPSGYRPGSVSAGGAVAGTITLQAAADSVVAVGKDARWCGDSARVLEVSASGGSLANALVWIEGVPGGKPLPELRRRTLTIERCRFEPQIVATVTGATINVLSHDRAAHDLRFYREGSTEPVTYANTVDAGQVVPSERLAAEPGIVEARCTMHPWVRGYVAVFEHPYFAVTDEKGAFRIDGLPAGTYGIKVWHRGMDRPVERRVVVGAQGEGRVDVIVSLR